MTALDELLERLPPGSHVRIVKCRRWPDWNPWCVIAYQHRLTGKVGRRGQPRLEYVELTRAGGTTMLDAARECLVRLEAHLDQSGGSTCA